MKLKRSNKIESVNTKMSPEEALIWYEKQLKEYPNDTGLLRGKATILENMGHDEKALRCYMLAVETNPHNTICWYRMGILLEGKGDYDAALESYNEAVKVDPRFIECWLKIGNLFRMQNFIENAKECYRWILEIDPEHRAAKKALVQIEGNILKSHSNHTPKGFDHKGGNKTKTRRKRKKRKKKMGLNNESEQSIKSTTKEVQKKPEPLLENLIPRTKVEKQKEQEEDISIEQLVENLEELNDILINKREPEAETSTDDFSGIGVEGKDKGDSSFNYEDFTEQLCELRDTIEKHTEKLTGMNLEDDVSEEPQTNIPINESSFEDKESPIPPNKDLEYPTFDDIDAQLEELTGVLAITDEPLDSPDWDIIEAGLDTLEKMFEVNTDFPESINANDQVSLTNEALVDSSNTDEQTHVQIKEFENALNNYNQSQEPTSQSLDAWDPNSELIPKIYEGEISSEDLIAEGRKHMNNNDYDKALACFDRMIEYDPQCLDAWSAKGDLILQMRREEVSLEKLLVKGRMHLEKREYDKALGCFDHALELDPQCLDARSAKGIVLIEMDKGKKKRKIIS